MTDQDRPTPSPTQQDPPRPTASTTTSILDDTSAFRPQSSSSRKSVSIRQPPNRRPRPYRHRNSSSTSIDSTTFLDHRDQPQSLTRNMSIAQPHTHTPAHTHDRRRSHFRRSRPDGQFSSDETSDRDEEQEEEDDETMRLMMASARQFAPWTKPRRTSMDESSRLLGSSDRLDM